MRLLEVEELFAAVASEDKVDSGNFDGLLLQFEILFLDGYFLELLVEDDKPTVLCPLTSFGHSRHPADNFVVRAFLADLHAVEPDQISQRFAPLFDLNLVQELSVPESDRGVHLHKGD